MCTQAAITKQAFAERVIFSLSGLMKFAYQEIIMELLQGAPHVYSDRGVVGVFVCLRLPCRLHVTVFARALQRPDKHNSLFIPLLQIELLRDASFLYFCRG